MTQLKAAVEQLSRTYPELRFTWGTPNGEFRPFAPPPGEADDTLDLWLSAIGHLVPGLDRKTTASYLLSILTWQLGQVLGALYLSRLPLPRFGPDQVGVLYALTGPAGAQ